MQITKESILHRLHLIGDLAIGTMAIAMQLIPAGMFPMWFQVDMFFHMTVAGVMFSVIGTERILHRSLHKPSKLHKTHLYAECAIGSFAIITFFTGDMLTSTWTDVDTVFHIVIAAMAFGGIILERVLHRHNHEHWV